MLWKCYTQYASKFGKLSSGHKTGKGVFILIPKKGNAKERSYYGTIALISHAIKVMLKMLQTRLQQYVNWLQYSKYPAYEQVLFQEHIHKSNKVSLGTQLIQ